MAVQVHLHDYLGSIILGDSNQNLDYANRCMCAIVDSHQKINVSLQVSGLKTQTYILDGNNVQNLGSYRNPSKNVELGAVALSFVIAHDLLGYDEFFEGVYGEGIDYWMSNSKAEDSYNYLDARLEVSGIGKESPTNTLEQRLQKKLKQTEPTDNTGLDAYVCIVEFGTPKASFVKK